MSANAAVAEPRLSNQAAGPAAESRARHPTRLGRDEGLHNFLAQVRRHPLLTPADEIKLAKRVEQGDAQAFEQMVVCNLRLVVAVARTHESPAVALLDLVQEGSTGLMRAVEHFDWRRGVKFSTYAIWWIRSACRRAVRDGASLRLPASLADRRRQLRDLDQALTARLGRQATNDELAAAARLTPGQVAHARELPVSNRSLFGARAPNGDDALIDLIADEPVDWDGDLARAQARRLLRAAVARLPERACIVITGVYGLDGQKSRSRPEIADDLGLTTERVRQIERDALARLACGRDIGELREVAC